MNNTFYSRVFHMGKGVNMTPNEEITKAYVDLLKSGISPMQKSYQDADFREYTSFYSGKPYKGYNRISLGMSKEANQLYSNAFLTFNQATKIAGISPQQIQDVRDRKKPSVTLESINHPLAGQKKVGFVVYVSDIYMKGDAVWSKTEDDGSVRTKPTYKEIKDENIKKERVEEKHFLWSMDQMSYIPKTWTDKRKNKENEISKLIVGDNSNERLRELAKTLIKKNEIKVVTGESPDYDEKRDVIIMPKINYFVSDSSFYRSLVHQIVHWTGHKDRLNRSINKLSENNSKIEDIAREELIVEMGSAFMCQSAGVDSFTSSNLENHVSMINSWLNLLENDSQALVSSATSAEKSASYLIKSLSNEVAIKNERLNGFNL
jgi:antirestriction protein ArdC